MAKIPSAADLGGTPTPAATRPVGSYDVTPWARGAAAIAQAGAQLGRGIEQAGEGAGELALDQGRWEYATAHADFLTRQVDLQNGALHDQNYGPDDSGKTLPQRHEAALNEQLDKSAQLISDPRMRTRFTQTMAPDVARSVAAVDNHARTLANNASVAYVQQQGDATIDRAIAAPDDDTRRALFDSHNQLVEGLVAKGAITAEQAVQRKKAWATQYATADYLAAINSNDPARIQAAIARLQGAPGSGDAITSRILQAEGTAKNPNSSAAGAGQFIDSTWLDMIKRHRPDLAQGRSDAEILALRADRNLGREMTDAYRQENEAYLKRQGLPATPGQQYLAHFLGPGAATAVLKADPNLPVIDALTQAVGRDKAQKIVAANRSVLDGQLSGTVAQWADRKMGGGDTYELLHLNPVVREELLTRGQAALHKQVATDIATFHNSVQDDLAEADRTGLVAKPKALPDFIQHYGADKGPAAFREYQAALQLGADKQKLAAMTQPQIDELISSYEPKAGQEGYAGAVKRLDALTAAAHQEGQKRLKASLDADMGELARTGAIAKPKTRADFDLALGEDKGGEAFDAYETARRTASRGRMLPGATPGQARAIVEDAAPQPGPGYVGAAKAQASLAATAQKLAKERDDDPAQYGINYLPAVTESWKALTDTMGDATASPQVRAAMARDYAVKQVMEQQRLGVDRDAIRIAPKAYTDHIAGQLTAAATDDDPSRRLALVGQLQREAAMWGGYWPLVMAEIAPKSVPLVRAIAADADAQGRPLHPQVMTQLVSLKPSDSVHSILGVAEGDTKAKDVHTDVAAAFKDFRATLLPLQISRDYAGYIGLAEKLAALHVRDGDKSDVAAKKAFTELIGDRYEFRDTWRMPKEAQVSADEVQQGTLAARAALSRAAADPKAQAFGVVPFAPDVPGIADNRADSLTRFARDGRFVTAPGNDGLNLYVTNPRTGQSLPVNTADGKPLLLKWADLARMAKDAPRTPDVSVGP
jgi:hypothetical protein